VTDRKRSEVDWEDIWVFLALARHGSLSAAARVLGVTHATVARRLRSLERSLGGGRLVERRPEGYVLNPAGMQALAVAGEMEGAAQALARDAGDGMPSGLIRINAPPGVALGFLTARLASIAARYTALDIDLATNLRSVSLDRHEADIAIRMGRPDDGDMIAKPLVTVGFGLYGTDGACRRIEDGAPPVFVGFDEADASMPDAQWLSRHFPHARVAFRANNHYAQAIAARAGVGIAVLPHYIGRSDPALRIVDLGAAPPPRDLFILTRTRDRRDFAIRAVADDIARAFAEERALFE